MGHFKFFEHIASREKYIFHMLFGAFHITPRINKISETLDFEDISINIEEFLQNSIDYLFYMFQ